MVNTDNLPVGSKHPTRDCVWFDLYRLERLKGAMKVLLELDRTNVITPHPLATLEDIERLESAVAIFREELKKLEDS